MAKACSVTVLVYVGPPGKTLGGRSASAVGRMTVDAMPDSAIKAMYADASACPTDV
jgi:hypothetical protein